MKTNSLEELAAHIMMPMKTATAEVLFREIVAPTIVLLARGEPVSPEEIAAATGKPPEEIRAALESWPSVEWDEQGRVIGSGVTLRPTPHRFEVESRTLFTWCALDTLMFPVILGRPASIESPCRGTGELVHIEVTPMGIRAVDPPSAVVSVIELQDLDSLRSVFCENVHFFVSPEAVSRWLEKHPQATVLPVEEAFRLGWLIAKDVMSPSAVGG